MNSFWIVILSVLTIYLVYNFYAKRIDRDVIQPDPKRATPARMYMDGVDFMRKAASTCPSARRVLLTGSLEHPKVAAARQEGLVEVIPKAADLETVLDRLGLVPGGPC